MVKQLDDMEAFKAAVAKPIAVVDFMASWCGPCNGMAPAYEALSKKYPNVDFSKVDVDDNSDPAEEHDVESLPTILIFVNGEKKETQVGADMEKLEALIQKHGGKAEL